MCLYVFSFYERWKQAEAMHAEMLQFSLDDDQWEQDWAVILSIASQPGDWSHHCLSLLVIIFAEGSGTYVTGRSICSFGCQLNNLSW